MLLKKGRAQAEITPDRVLDALRTIIDPDLHRDIVSLGMIKDLAIAHGPEGSFVKFVFELTTPACPVRDQFKKQAEAVVSALPGVSQVEVTMSANVRQSTPRTQAQIQLPQVKNIIAVGSGKGGVGKSTVAANLATALAATGASVGLLDADVYGPSVPQLMGVHEGARVEDRKLVPHQAHGVKLMSLGLLTQDDRPVIWRGPMVGQAVKQLLSDVSWGDLDYLLVDLPPGTGDAPLTLIQSIPLSGIVVVTTPQDVALGIATKTLAMFRGLNVPILGIVENMSGFECPNCGYHSHIFSAGGGQAAAEKLKVPFLGALPLDESVRRGGDEGVPAPIGEPDSSAAQLFASIAQKLAAQVSIRSTLSFSLAVK
jgi:ATP-binding protein involved in chromosome partitioning